MRILWVFLAAILFAVPAAEGAPLGGLRDAARAQPTTSVCDRYAAPEGVRRRARVRARRRHHRGRPGSRANPYTSPQRLVSALGPGQTGCLEGGTYRLDDQELSFRRSGLPSDPITLRSAPRTRATIDGGPVYIPNGSNDIRLEKLNLETDAIGQAGVQIMSSDDALVGDRITNHADHATCIILGSNAGWGEAERTVLRDDVIHDCGSPQDGNQDHAIYFDNSVDAQVSHDIIWGTSGFAIHLYENARGNVIRENVLDHNRYGVIFAGNAGYRSSGNIVTDNVIADTTESYAVQSYWGGTVGVGNVLAHNCIYGAAKGPISQPTTGFRAIDNVIAPPRFVDPARHHFALRPDSGCLPVARFDMAHAVGHAARRHGGPATSRRPRAAPQVASDASSS